MNKSALICVSGSSGPTSARTFRRLKTNPFCWFLPKLVSVYIKCLKSVDFLHTIPCLYWSLKVWTSGNSDQKSNNSLSLQSIIRLCPSTMFCLSLNVRNFTKWFNWCIERLMFVFMNRSLSWWCTRLQLVPTQKLMIAGRFLQCVHMNLSKRESIRINLFIWQLCPKFGTKVSWPEKQPLIPKLFSVYIKLLKFVTTYLFHICIMVFKIWTSGTSV